VEGHIVICTQFSKISAQKRVILQNLANPIKMKAVLSVLAAVFQLRFDVIKTWILRI
jgi:hypothetical protein